MNDGDDYFPRGKNNSGVEDTSNSPERLIIRVRNQWSLNLSFHSILIQNEGYSVITISILTLEYKLQPTSFFVYWLINYLFLIIFVFSSII